MSTAEANSLVQQAVKSYKANDRATAKSLLLKAVDLDERHEQAWMWMSAVVDSMEEQQICLENVLSINPNNERAKKGLAIVNQKLGKSSTASPSSPPTVPRSKGSTAPLDPFAGQQDSDGELEDSPFGAWDSIPTEASAPSSIPTSVDWGDVGTLAHGSGQSADQPSAQQYDQWIDSLGINTDIDSGADPTTAPTSASPFGDSGAGDPWGSSSPPDAAQADPWGASPSDSSQADPWGRKSTRHDQADPWGASQSDTAQADPWGSSSPPDAAQADPWGASQSDTAQADPWGSSSPPDAAQADPWGASQSDTAQANSWGSSQPSDSDAFQSAPPEAADTGTDAAFSGASAFAAESAPETPLEEAAPTGAYNFESASNVFSGAGPEGAAEGEFVFDSDDGDDIDPFADVDDASYSFQDDLPSGSVMTSPFAMSASQTAAETSGYYQYIPAEIKARVGEGRSTALILAAVMLILNLAAVMGLLIA